MLGIYDELDGSPCNWATDFIGIYIGREEGFNCMICGKGCNAFCFNIYQGSLKDPTKAQVEAQIDNVGYETYGFGKEHLPEIMKEIS